MKKILLYETQYLKLKKYIFESKLRSYVFDWDDNILRMPTKVKMDKLVNGKWVPIEVTTEEFAHFRSNPDYKIKSNSFEDFTDNKKFLNAVVKAIKQKSFAPSYKKLIESLIYVNNFAINTARGHSPETIKKGVKLFINMVITPENKLMMIENIKKELPTNLTKNLNNDQLLDLYLDERGEYYPVSSKEFGERFGLSTSGTASNPEQNKQIAIEHFIKKLINGVKEHIINGKYKKISLGFSDDDMKNVRAVEDFIDNQLKKIYPEIHFVVYDTSKGGKKKMVIEKE
jgi:hypothetical protein